MHVQPVSYGWRNHVKWFAFKWHESEMSVKNDIHFMKTWSIIKLELLLKRVYEKILEKY